MSIITILFHPAGPLRYDHRVESGCGMARERCPIIITRIFFRPWYLLPDHTSTQWLILSDLRLILKPVRGFEQTQRGAARGRELERMDRNVRVIIKKVVY